MIQLFELATKSMGHFLAIAILIWMPFYVVYSIYKKAEQAKTIRKVGYPPPHCDASGEFKKEVKNNEDDDIE